MGLYGSQYDYVIHVHARAHCKNGIVISTNHVLSEFQVSEHITAQTVNLVNRFRGGDSYQEVGGLRPSHFSDWGGSSAHPIFLLVVQRNTISSRFHTPTA